MPSLVPCTAKSAVGRDLCRPLGHLLLLQAGLEDARGLPAPWWHPGGPRCRDGILPLGPAQSVWPQRPDTRENFLVLQLASLIPHPLPVPPEESPALPALCPSCDSSDIPAGPALPTPLPPVCPCAAPSSPGGLPSAEQRGRTHPFTPLVQHRGMLATFAARVRAGSWVPCCFSSCFSAEKLCSQPVALRGVIPSQLQDFA